jgi:hypothetical protein
VDGRKLTEELRRATRAQSEQRAAGAEDDDGDASGDAGGARSPFGWISFVIVAVLVVGGFYVVRTLQADAKLQDCVMAGRKNCAPVDTDTTPPAPAPR